MKKIKEIKITPMGLIYGIITLLGLASACMIFLNAFNITVTFDLGLFGKSVKTYNYTGVQSAFGYIERVEESNILVEHLTFNLLVFLGFLLPILAVVATLLFKNNKKLSVVGILLFIASAIMVFLSINSMPNSIVNYDEKYYSVSVGIGVILSGIFSALAGVILFFKTFLLSIIK